MKRRSVLDPNQTRRQEFEAILNFVARLPRPKLPYDQLSAEDLADVYFYNHVVICQLSYMILLRSFACRIGDGLLPEAIARKGGLTVEEVVAWGRYLTEKQLYEAYCAYPDEALTTLMIDIKIEEQVIGTEMAERLKNKPLAQELLRLDRDQITPDCNARLLKLLKIEKLQSHRPWEQERADILQNTMVKVLKVWDTPQDASADSSPLPPCPVPVETLLPDERAFWEGPLARGREIGRRTFLAEQIPMLTGALEQESLHKRAHNHRRNTWRTLANRETILAGSEDFPRYVGRNKDPEGAGRAEWDWAESAQKARQEDIVTQLHRRTNSPAELAEVSIEVQRLYRVADKRWGKKGRRFLDALRQGKDIIQASADANISRQTGHKYLKELRNTVEKKNLS